MTTIHQQRTHPQPVDGCAPCRWASVRLANWTSSPAGRKGFLRGWSTEVELEQYKAARAQGIQPRSTRLTDIEAAVDESRRADRPFDAADPVPMGEVIEL